MSKRKPKPNFGSMTEDQFKAIHEKAVEAERTMADLLAEYHAQLEGAEFIQFTGLVLCMMADRHFTAIAPMFDLDADKLRAWVKLWCEDVTDKVVERLPDLREFLKNRHPDIDFEDADNNPIGLKKCPQMSLT